MGFIGSIIGGGLGGAIGAIGGNSSGGAGIGSTIGGWLPFSRGGSIPRPPSNIELHDVQLLKRGGKVRAKKRKFQKKKKACKK